MARYALPTPMSMYRDTGAVEITRLFRERHMSNLAADDALAQSVLEMISMEQDEEAKRDLVDKYNTQLKQRSANDNYAMMGSAIQKDARSFINEYNPIKVQKQNYDSFIGQIEKDYSAGTINSNTRDKRKAEAMHNYDGLKFNLDGSVDENSQFRAPGYVRDVNIELEFQKHMKDVILKEIDTTDMEFAVGSDMASQFELKQGINPDTQAPAYYIQQGSYTKYLDEKTVASVINSVLSQSDVAASVRQEAHLNNFYKDKINTETSNTIASDEVNATISILEKNLDKLLEISNPDDSEKATIEYTDAMIDRLEAAQSKGVDDISILTALNVEDLNRNYLQNAIIKYAGVKSQKQVRKISESARFNQMQKIKSENPTGLAFTGEFTAAEPFGGTTLNSVTEKNVEIETSLEQFISQSGNEDILEDAFNQTSLEFAAKNNVSVETANRQISQIKTLLRQQDVLKLRTEQVYSALNTTEEEYTNNISEEFKDFKFRDTSVQEIVDALNTTGIIPDATVLQALEYISNLEKDQYDPGAYRGLNKSITEAILDSRKLTVGTNKRNEVRYNMGSEVAGIINSYNRKISADKVILDKELEGEIKIDGLIMPSFADPTTGTTTQFKNLFAGPDKKGRFPDSFKFRNSEGQILDWKTLRESGEGIWGDYKNAPPTIDFGKTGLFAVPTSDGKAAIAITFMGDDGTEEMYYADASQVTGQEGSALSTYINHPKFSVEKLWRQGESAKLKGDYYPLGFEDNDKFKDDKKTPNPYYGEPTIKFNYSEEKVYILDTNEDSPDYGEYIKYDLDLGLKAITGSLVQQNKNL
tara:strand:- start:5823 stop:8267 length:2445 start_codon:yes stop_codon:yes gene_type:complete